MLWKMENLTVVLVFGASTRAVKGIFHPSTVPVLPSISAAARVDDDTGAARTPMQ